MRQIYYTPDYRVEQIDVLQLRDWVVYCPTVCCARRYYNLLVLKSRVWIQYISVDEDIHDNSLPDQMQLRSTINAENEVPHGVYVELHPFMCVSIIINLLIFD